MITNYLRRSIALNVFSPQTQDLGEISCKFAIHAVINNEPYTRGENDFLTAYMVDSIKNAEEIEDIESDFNYAISMLQKAKNAALFGELKH